MESEPDCLLYFSIPTSVWENSTKKEEWEKKKQNTFLGVKKNIRQEMTSSKPKSKERHYRMCDNCDESPVSLSISALACNFHFPFLHAWKQGKK